MKQLALLTVILVITMITGNVWANNADRFERAEVIVNNEALKDFLNIYNNSSKKGIRYNNLYFDLSSINENQQTFVASVCRKKNQCSKSEINSSSEYLLLLADINNDSAQEYILLKLAPTANESDKIIGVYSKINKQLQVQPFESLISSSLGKQAVANWPKHINDPFITRFNGNNYFNFQDALIWKDENGEQIFSHQLDKAAYGEMSFYRYLWKGDTITLDYKDTIQRKRQASR